MVTFLQVVVGEMVPKNIALAGPDRAALVLAPPLVLIVRILFPVIWVLNQLANMVLAIFKVAPKDEVTSAFTRNEVANMVSESRSGGQLDRREERLLLGALTFDERESSRSCSRWRRSLPFLTQSPRKKLKQLPSRASPGSR